MALPGEQHQQPEEDGDQKSMEMTTDTQKKIDVVGMRSLADQWRTARFPHCEEIQRINQATAQFERTAVAVRKVLNRKIRLRDQTRCQKADTRWEYAEVHNLRQQLADSMFEDRELEDGIQELCQRVEGWKSRANAAFARPFAGIQTVDMLYALVSEAEEDFNVKMEAEGLDRLRAELARCQWLLKADQIVRRVERNTKVKSEGGGGTAPTAAEVVATRRDTDEDGTLQLKPEEAGRGESIGTIMEGGKAEPDEEEDEEQQKRVDLQALAKTIADGVRWCAQCATVQAVHAKLEQFLRTAAATAVGFEEAQQQWHAIAVEEGELFGTDWIQSPAMDNFRAELKLAQLAYNDFELLSRNAFSLRNLEQLEHYFAQSLFERDGQRHGQLKVWLDRLQRFVERIRTIFQKAVSYYTMFDIVAGRSDLPALIEGEPMPLALFTSNKYSENWRQLRPFVSRDQLLGHLRSIADQQCTLLHALRLTNAGRSPKETCCCARDAQPALTRRQRSQCSAAAASRTNGRGGGGDDQHPRKRSSLPSRRRTGEAGGSAEISSPTMVVDGRRTTAALSSSSREEQQQQLQQQHREGEEDGQKAQQQADNHAGGGRGGTDRRLTTTTVNDMIPCFVCNASLHVACAQWDPFLARLPLGVLLCQRCLRSRRPCVEDVEAACYSSELPENCLERIVVQNLFHRSGDVFTQLQRLLHTIPKGTKQIEPNVETSLKKWLTMALSLEVTDIEVYNALANSAYFDLFPLPERQIQIWHHVRERMVDAEPLPFIFGHSIASSSSVASGGGGGGGSGRRTSNAGGKRRSSNNNNSNNNNINNSHHPNHSSIVANKSSCSSATSSSSLSFHAFASSPSKQRRRRASVDDNDGVSNSNGLEKHRAAMLLEKQQKDGKNGGGGGIDDDRTMEEESEEGTIDQQQQQQQNGGSGGGQMEKCAADFCLRPYSEFTRWIQCEAGCARWYHFCCVGISVRGAQRISAYCCYKCATAAEAVASSTSTAAQTALSTTTNTTIVVAAVAAIEQQQQPHSPHSSSAAATTTTTAAATAAAATV
uniref:DHC_N2 domain-containing protein n=1 Tax=Globodera pallida TaxID=36090 RepID=A0A183CM42_GLOPA